MVERGRAHPHSHLVGSRNLGDGGVGAKTQLIEGAVSVYAADGELAGRLARGDSAIVPIGVGAYRVAADAPAASVVKVDVPVDG